MLQRGCLLLLAVAALLAAPARATITDTGEVAVVGGVLQIGQTTTGLRVVDGEADGPYDGAQLGIGPVSSGELDLQNATSFSTSGALELGIGVSAAGIVNVGQSLGLRR